MHNSKTIAGPISQQCHFIKFCDYKCMNDITLLAASCKNDTEHINESCESTYNMNTFTNVCASMIFIVHVLITEFLQLVLQMLSVVWLHCAYYYMELVKFNTVCIYMVGREKNYIKVLISTFL